MKMIENRYEHTSYEMRKNLEIYHCCYFCGETDGVIMEKDHIIPLAILKKHFTGNREILLDPFLYVMLCANCHKRKSRMEWMSEKYEQYGE